MPQLRYDIQRVAELADIYANASPDLWDGLDDAATTARTLNAQRGDLDTALLAAVGFANTGADSIERSAPYLVRGAADLVPTAKLLEDYRGMIFCTIRNYHDVGPRVYATLGGNGYSLASAGTLIGAGNPYIYPDNLPRISARGGPEGRPGLLAEDHPGAVADAVSGDGHRVQHRPLQPRRTRTAARDRLRLGPPDRRAHHQPVTLTSTIVQVLCWRHDVQTP